MELDAQSQDGATAAPGKPSPAPMEGLAQSSPPTKFVITGLIKRFTGYVLEIDNLEIPSGVGLFTGPSGAGKSTLLNLLSGLDQTAEQGSIIYVDAEGEEFEVLREGRGTSHAQALRSHAFSYVFQTSNLLQNLPLRKNIRIFRELVSRPDISEEELRQSEYEIIRSLFPELNESSNKDLDSWLRKFPSERSVGQRQRVAVCRGLLKGSYGSRVLFADEPTANLDEQSADLVFTYMRAWAKGDPNNCLLMATHDPLLKDRGDWMLSFEVMNDQKPGEQGHPQMRVRPHLVPSERINASQDPIVAEPSRPNAVSGQRKPRPKPRKRWGPVQRCRLAFVPEYAWYDNCRPRELVESALRSAVLLVMLAVVGIAAFVYESMPKLVDAVFESDRLIKEVQLRRTNRTPFDAAMMERFASVGLDAQGQVAFGITDESRRLVEGVAPKTHSPMVLPYTTSGHVPPPESGEQMRVVYPGAATPDPLPGAWNLPDVEWDDGVVVSPGLLARLGYADEFVDSALAGEPRVLRAAIDSRWGVDLPIVRVADLANVDTDLLISHDVLERITMLKSPFLVPRYTRCSIGSFDSLEEARDAARQLEPVVAEFIKNGAEENLDARITVTAGRAIGAAGFEASLVASGRYRVIDAGARLEMLPDIDNGLTERAWRGLVPGEFQERVRVQRQVVASDSRRARESLPMETGRIAVYAKSYRDVPDLVAFLARSEKPDAFAVDNKESAESVRTMMAASEVLRMVVLVSAVAFVGVSLVGIGYSFFATIRRKLKEIGTLRAFGSPRWLLLARFGGEAALVTGIAAAISTLLVATIGVPTATDTMLAFLPEVYDGASDGVAFSAGVVVWTGISAVAVCALTFIIMLLHSLGSPRQLLSMGE